MKVLLYTTEKSKVGERLEKMIKASINGTDVQVHRSIEMLTHKLCEPMAVSCEDIVVFLAASKKDLQDILSVRHLINDVRVIIILPDMEKATIAKGHLLRPRFLTFNDNNFEVVTAVLSKMIANKYQLHGF
jgi:hypothetical protein